MAWEDVLEPGELRCSHHPSTVGGMCVTCDWCPRQLSLLTARCGVLSTRLMRVVTGESADL